jgi:hypothetical protein
MFEFRTTVATLQQPEFGLQQNDVKVTIRPTAVLQICKQSQDATPNVLNSLALLALRRRAGAAAPAAPTGRGSRWRPDPARCAG